MNDTIKPTRKMLWFTADQIRVLNELKELTGKANSEIVRIAMLVYLEQLKANDGEARG